MTDLDAVEARYSAALDARPSKGLEIGSADYTALTDAVADVPDLVAEVRRLGKYAQVLEQGLSDEDDIASRFAQVLTDLRTWPVRQAAGLAVCRELNLGYDHRRYSHRFAEAVIDAALAAAEARPSEGP